MFSGSSSVPSASDSSSRKERTVFVTRTGNVCRPSRPTASHSSVMALSLLVIDPCPAVPSTVSRIQWMPFCAVSTRYSRSCSFTVNENPPTSPIASVTPSNRSRWLSTRCRAPYTPPASSSARKASTTSRGGLRPLRIRSLTTARVMASMSFMSTAPRPHTQPSAISPENGWCVQSSALAGTTSVCP